MSAINAGPIEASLTLSRKGQSQTRRYELIIQIQEIISEALSISGREMLRGSITEEGVYVSVTISGPPKAVGIFEALALKRGWRRKSGRGVALSQTIRVRPIARRSSSNTTRRNSNYEAEHAAKVNRAESVIKRVGRITEVADYHTRIFGANALARTANAWGRARSAARRSRAGRVYGTEEARRVALNVEAEAAAAAAEN